MERRFGLDWLRIGGFALLILYHIGMVFVPWDYHVKAATTHEWLEAPMLAVNPWRLALLFVVSGVASRMLLARATAGGFAKSRTARLLPAVLFGMAVVCAPQAWAEVSQKNGYTDGFWTFWARDYFQFGPLFELTLPTWNHLWFVVYLWLYALLLALARLAPAAARARAQIGFDRVFGGWRLVVLPVLWFFAARMTLYPTFGETHSLTDDPYAHAVYAFAFFFGVGLARAALLWRDIARAWRPAAVGAVGAYGAFIVGIALAGDATDPTVVAALRLVRSTLAWLPIVALLGAAERYLNIDTPARRYLTEAVFPYYIAHQTIIVLVAFWLRPVGLGGATESVVVLAATVAGCALTYEFARRAGPLRPLFGLKPPARRRPWRRPDQLETSPMLSKRR